MTRLETNRRMPGQPGDMSTFARWRRLPTNLRMTLRSIVRDLREGFGKRNLEAKISGHLTWKSTESSDELQDGLVAIPISLKQPGSRDGLVQCFIKRDKSKQTYHLYLSLTSAVLQDDNGKFLLSAKRSRRMTYSDYAISMDSKNISRSSSGYIGRLRSNFLGTKFIIYDTQPPYNARTLCPQERTSRRFSSRKVSPKVPAGNYPIAQVNYESNLLGTCGPRRMQCTMHSIPTTAVKESPLVLRNKSPRWNGLLQSWCLNFWGRVTVCSVKNFQLIAAPSPPATTGATVAASEPLSQQPAQQQQPASSSSSSQDTVLLQFGKVSKDTFTMDYRYPLSAFQAFAICLTSFDTKLACQ